MQYYKDDQPSSQEAFLINFEVRYFEVRYFEVGLLGGYLFDADDRTILEHSAPCQSEYLSSSE